MVNEYKHCLSCGTEINYGRQDKKFCSESCKNLYHNKDYQVLRNYRLRVTNSLDRNYSILEMLIKKQIRSIDRADLIELGYKDQYMTSCRKIGTATEYRCFDIKFLMSKNRIYSIERIVVDVKNLI